MKIIRLIAIAGVFALVSGCSPKPLTCEEASYYQDSRLNDKVAVPDDLDPPADYKEMKIPEIDAQPRTTNTDKCLDYPPVLGGDS